LSGCQRGARAGASSASCAMTANGNASKNNNVTSGTTRRIFTPERSPENRCSHLYNKFYAHRQSVVGFSPTQKDASPSLWKSPQEKMCLFDDIGTTMLFAG